ncbi:MAG: type II toxin-antitoxin system HigB family toxin [Leptolyngbyaceae cyanobacterium]
MRIITRRRLREFWQKHSQAETSLRLWYTRTSSAQWQSLTDVRQVFRSADQVGNFTVFNIAGNNYRLITLINYNTRIVFIRYVLTHAEYDKEDWKNDPWFRTT